jgi:SRSO17 transposase
MGGTVDVGQLSLRDVESLAEHLSEFMKPYLEVVGWSTREKQLSAFVAGLLGGTERKSVEPIALAQGVDRQQLQYFVGVSPWDYLPLLDVLQGDVSGELGDPEGVLVIDGSAMPKKGSESVGVARQWCGRLGKVENCQIGIYLAYAGKGSCAILDERLYLPRAWVLDPERRAKAKVPASVTFKKAWVLGDEMLRQVGTRLPHKWVVADAEYGRSKIFRDRMAKRGERYMLEVPSNTLVRKVAGKAGRRPEWHRVSDFVKRRPISEWQRLTVRDGQKEPIEVIATAHRVQTRRRGKPRVETLLAIEALASTERWFFLSNTPQHTPLEEMVGAASRRHLIEEAFENAKGEVGLDHYEVRAWRGWHHHHMTASLMALWFLVREHRKLGKAPLSVAMVRFMICELLRRPLSPRDIVMRCRYQLWRNEEARINHWLARGLQPPSWRASRNFTQ